jgi:hypothetical protein
VFSMQRSYDDTDASQKLSTYEFEDCVSPRELREHGPDDFYQIVVGTFPETHPSRADEPSSTRRFRYVSIGSLRK